MPEDKDGNYKPLDLEEVRLQTHRMAIEMPEIYLPYFASMIEVIQTLEGERGTNQDLCKDITLLERKMATLRLERDGWRKRAEQHGCNVEEGDPECG